MSMYIGPKEDEGLRKYAEKLILTRIQNFPGITLEEIFEIKPKSKHKEKYKTIITRYVKKKLINVMEMEYSCYYPAPALEKYSIINPEEEREIYNTIIYPAFKKLSESLIYKFNQKTDDPNNDLRDECISHLMFQIVKYDFDQGNSFRFFNMVCKNFILQHIGRKKKNSPIMSLYRKDPSDAAMGTDENTMGSEILDDRFVDESYKTAAEDQEEFIKYLLIRLAKYAARCKDNNERIFVTTIITQFENAKITPSVNKRIIYLMIRNATDFKNRDITMYLNNLKEEYAKVIKTYYSS